MTPLLILGDGAFALETLDIAEAAGRFRPLGFVNSVARPEPNARLAGLPVFWIDALPFQPDGACVVTGIGSTKRRHAIETMLARGSRFVAIVHPSAVVSPRASIGDGCVINAGAVISRGAVIEPHVVLNRGCLIGHDTRIGSFATVGPGANIAGGVEIGSSAYIGIGAVVRDHLSVGAESVVGAGAVVLKDVAPNTMVAGVPARIIRTGVVGL
jgi:sugar O-acyltransferase (sialic acid O-acetyltransferase NeuD family)